VIRSKTFNLRYRLLEISFRMASRYIKNRIEGLENLPPKGEGYVAAANHRSFADAAILPQTLVTARKEPVHMVSYSELFRIPVQGTILRWAQGLVLDRGSKQGIERFFNDAKYVLTERHEAVGLHPEAHISKTGKLGRGRTGAARLSIETGCPVVPIALFGTDVVVPVSTQKVSVNYKRRALSFRAGRAVYFNRYRKAYDGGDGRQKKEILDGITTLIMLEIAKLTGQEYHFGERSLAKLQKYD
jgi:1-acyl-sn-glycerol-3-phosphate acyltransferase